MQSWGWIDSAPLAWNILVKSVLIAQLVFGKLDVS